MKRSMKIIFVLFLCTLGYIVISAFFNYLDLKYFEGFWGYLFTKSKSVEIEPRYQKYIPLRNLLVNVTISISILASVVLTIYWKIRINRKVKRK